MAEHHQPLPHNHIDHPLHTMPTIKEGQPQSPQSPNSNNHPYTLKTTSTTSLNGRGHSSQLGGIRSAMGLHAQAPIDPTHDEAEHTKLLWPKIRLTLREPFLEFWGTLIFVMFGTGSVAQVLLTTGLTTAPGGDGFGSYQSISWGWAIGIMLGIYVAGDSGGFLNPAVTFTFCLYRGLPWRRFPILTIAQFLGGFVGSGIIYANYIGSIDNYAGVGVRTAPPAEGATAGIFCTFPAGPFLNTANKFFSEFIASAVLMFVIFAMKDASNTGGIRADGNWFPLGYALNLARDFGPRIMASIVGYSGMWSAGNYYFWIPIVAPFCGCVTGGGLYDLFIYTGPESPINSPYMGVPHLLRPDKALNLRWAERSHQVPGGVAEGYVDAAAAEKGDQNGASI